LIPDRVAKQKYQNNIQLYPGAPGIPASRIFYFSPDIRTRELAVFINTDKIGCHRSAAMENLVGHPINAGKLGIGSREMEAISHEIGKYFFFKSF